MVSELILVSFYAFSSMWSIILFSKQVRIRVVKWEEMLTSYAYVLEAYHLKA